ncbi:Txe/YoeB family addiction module toxin [Mobiluncus mulieris]|uniref:Endoribonuclease YoeB n=1 Tax=Mobiluncus mulieris TaxID=2052 RepID=A0A2J9KS23_9ACTO|nr:Txe/YoeB family addiction module toxin [Mobiluncus mulieris]EEJ54587.1 addiction module toxin, Txe/YoeB family [Mobiluncus mulieris ATCC 35243]MBB5846462.1 toxin YoeB [Mobiluncus mulieris]MCU9969671.1 Txe/YoeB family addiction module toxin [Mobiluncus mulieris]MCU9973997.1 Txe/YoeB family addiction module toxin [Mobiluncus mulieris]MCU9995897.1 Txe/YoeB family addiction module toxin [Mobiluncus mulieris]
MQKLWHDQAWMDYLYWQTQDRKTLQRINRLIVEIERGGSNGKPPAKAELLRHSETGLRSVRIDKGNRLIYGFIDAQTLVIVSCRGHYR